MGVGCIRPCRAAGKRSGRYNGAARLYYNAMSANVFPGSIGTIPFSVRHLCRGVPCRTFDPLLPAQVPGLNACQPVGYGRPFGQLNVVVLVSSVKLGHSRGSR